jgi:hypothetical protein
VELKKKVQQSRYVAADFLLGGKDRKERRKGKKARFLGCNKSIEDFIAQCTSIDKNLV